MSDGHDREGMAVSEPRYRDKGDRLGKFIEECGEALAAAGKTVRFGWDSWNPELPPNQRETNEAWLRREIADLEEAIRMLKKSRYWRDAETEGERE